MHDNEVDIDLDLVRRMVAEQLPDLADRAITQFASTGTVNAVYRLGPDLCVRLPRLPHWAADLEREMQWLPRLAPALSLEVPQPVARGRPVDAYALPWAVYRWIEGDPYSDTSVVDERGAAVDLARFVVELRSAAPVDGAPPGGRRPLPELDGVTRDAIEESSGVIDGAAALDAWDRALRAPAWDGDPVWVHTDLLPPNLLVRDGRLAAVLDFGGVGAGDPAADVVPGWSVFGPAGREVFRAELDVDDGTWERARGYALHQAALIVPYYRETNPRFVTTARRTIDQVLSDVGP